MVSTIYDIEEIYSKGRRKVQVYAKDLLCYLAVRELGKSININRYNKLFTGRTACCGDGEAKFWLEPKIELAQNYRLSLWFFSNLVVESLVYFQRKIA
jgi:hypothetical protein